jgi:hypothetical protein
MVLGNRIDTLLWGAEKSTGSIHAMRHKRMRDVLDMRSFSEPVGDDAQGQKFGLP